MFQILSATESKMQCFKEQMWWGVIWHHWWYYCSNYTCCHTFLWTFSCVFCRGENESGENLYFPFGIFPTTELLVLETFVPERKISRFNENVLLLSRHFTYFFVKKSYNPCPYVLTIIIVSLLSGQFTAYYKNTVIHPPKKKEIANTYTY